MPPNSIIFFMRPVDESHLFPFIIISTSKILPRWFLGMTYNLLKGRTLLHQGIMWAVGSRNQTSIQSKLVSSKPQQCMVSGVSDIISSSKSWDLSGIADYISLWRNASHSSYSSKPEHFLWQSYLEDGTFLVKSVHYMTTNSNMFIRYVVQTSSWRSIWNLQRLSISCGKAAHHALPLLLNLSCCLPSSPSIFLHCLSQEVSVSHCILLCPYSASIWERVSVQLNVLVGQDPELQDKLLEWILCRLLNHQSKSKYLFHMFMLCWFIWKDRNEVIFRNATVITQIYCSFLAGWWRTSANGIALRPFRGSLFVFLVMLRFGSHQI